MARRVARARNDATNHAYAPVAHISTRLQEHLWSSGYDISLTR